MQQEISQAADAAVRKYTDTTPESDRRPPEIAHAMRVGAKERTKTLMVKMGKLLAVAHPSNGPGFLEEVSSLWKFCIIVFVLFYFLDLTNWEDCWLGGTTLEHE